VMSAGSKFKFDVARLATRYYHGAYAGQQFQALKEAIKEAFRARQRLIRKSLRLIPRALPIVDHLLHGSPVSQIAQQYVVHAFERHVRPLLLGASL
jgi:hypothetical protein